MSYLLCYRLHTHHPYDEEDVWAFVSRHGGSFEMGAAAFCMDFYLHESWAAFILIKYPLLERKPALDYII